jgi:hypothetical protein
MMGIIGFFIQVALWFDKKTALNIFRERWREGREPSAALVRIWF